MRGNLLFLAVLVFACTREDTRRSPSAMKQHPPLASTNAETTIQDGELQAECANFIPHTVGGDVTAPVVLRRVEPNYPEIARRFKVSEIHLSVFIRRDGSVCAVRVVRAGSPEFDGPIVTAVRQWQFAPAKQNGVAVDCVYPLIVKIRLR